MRELVGTLRELLQEDKRWSDKELTDAIWESYSQWNQTPPVMRSLRDLLARKAHWKLPLLWGALCVLLREPQGEDVSFWRVRYLASLYSSAWQRYGEALEYKLLLHEVLHEEETLDVDLLGD